MNLVHVLNGPNLGRLELRDSSQYGTAGLDEIAVTVTEKASELGLDVEWHQTDHEGRLVELIHAAIDAGAAIVINPGALTHYSYAVADALAMSDGPVIEVHLSNIYAREDWRQKSVIAPAVSGSISGIGPAGYLLGLEAVKTLAQATDEGGSRSVSGGESATP